VLTGWATSRDPAGQPEAIADWPEAIDIAAAMDNVARIFFSMG
jgi:hypothetical protein